ncbi:TPR-like protein [Sistotremastrum niveocremeum HHB9708]|uniref:TPR-like protein n=1 Tax=Sistotremastrum niveocremeum HHB9708 TaxID=1314777 RepID=A0A165AGC9_9AGAM|nr:TPR-like protein [Sistotremastrum niveocremeum HHB9708]
MASRPNPHIDSRFKTTIWQLLDTEQYRSALFFAERYFCRDGDNHEARHLYSTALLKNGQTQSALHLVNLAEEEQCQECVEIYAKCCSTLGRFRAAREALERIVTDPTPVASSSSSIRPPIAIADESVFYCRAGVMAAKGNQPERAISNFEKALNLNPLLWEAFEGLCSLGSFPNIDEVFADRTLTKDGSKDDLTNSTTGVERKPSPLPMATGMGFFTPAATNDVNQIRNFDQQSQPFRLNPESSDSIQSGFGFSVENSMTTRIGSNFRGLGVSGPTIPNLGLIANSRTMSSVDEMGPAPKKHRTASLAPIKANGDKGKQTMNTGVTQKPPPRAGQPDANTTRRSTRLLSSGVGGKEQTRTVKHPPTRDRSRRPNARTRSRSHGSDNEDMLSPDTAHSPPTSSMHSPQSEGSPGPSTHAAQRAAEAMEWEAADKYIFHLLRSHAIAYQHMARYSCKEVIEAVENLTPDMQKSTSILSLVGRAYYEMVDYQKAEAAFKAARTIDPYRVWDMEIYSTLLWHLQKNVKLSFLGQELVSIDPQAPQAWIAIGNCFSLQKERSQALTCFRKASNLDPTCAYAYTLSGHESLEEDIDTAIGFFRTAIRADPRHYNAWYGLGTCYLRMSKLRQAEYHYRRASEIHPHNAVLKGCMAMAMERRGQREEAYQLYEEAVRLAPDNPLVRYRRAKILISMKRYDDALEDLLRLRDIAPEESNVVFQLAKVYRLMGSAVQSALQLATARDMSPKSLGKIKRLVETSQDEDGARDGEMDEG